MTDKPVLIVRDATKVYALGNRRAGLDQMEGHTRAVDSISFELSRGETLALVGESGSGKSTLGRMVLGLESTTGGMISFDGKRISESSERALRPLRSRMQMIFQDPFGSLNPRLTVRQAIEEPLAIHGLENGRAGRRRRVEQLLDMVGIPRNAADRYPHEFSGGQRQRIGIARAISVSPEMIVADEAVSALDVSIQAQIINLLIELQAELNLAHLFIAHDLSVVRQIADRVMVMYRGRMMELATTDKLFSDPRHPYTKMLIEAAPVPDPRVESRRSRSFTAGSDNDWRTQFDPTVPVGRMTEVSDGHYVAA